MSLTALPDDGLKLVMQLVPVKDRLRNCCLVSTRMHAAAIAATQSLSLPEMPLQHAESALKWLPRYGQHMTRLQLLMFPQPLRELPCKDLLELDISHCRVQLAASADGFPGVLQSCNALTRLQLRCNIIDISGCCSVYSGLSSMVHLQHLELVTTSGDGRWPVKVAGLPEATLPRLQHLTHLHVQGLSAENLMQLPSLTSLRELHLHYGGCTRVGPTYVPGLAFPASLTKLVLLSSAEAGVLSLAPTGLQHLELLYDVAGPAEGPGSFLSCVARLTCLTVLILQDSREWPRAGPAYAALTASSNLVRLEMLDPACPDDGIWPHVFPATHKLPHLTSFMVRDQEDESDNRFCTRSFWDAADLASLVSCCPSLRAVGSLFVGVGRGLLEMHKLTALTHLHVQCELVTGCPSSLGAYVKGLAAVTQLEDLVLEAVYFKDGGCEPDVASLLPLTRLTALTRFVFDLKADAVESDDMDNYGAPFAGDDDVQLELSTPQDSYAPDVWQQLLNFCSAEAARQATDHAQPSTAAG